MCRICNHSHILGFELILQFSLQSLSHVRLFTTPWTAPLQASLSITNSQSLLKLMFIESVMPPNQLILCCPLLLPSSVFPSIRVFSNESVLCITLPKFWSFSFNISPSNGYSGLISFRIDWLYLLAVQGILKSLLQHQGSKVSILRHWAFFIVQLSHPYRTTGSPQLSRSVVSYSLQPNKLQHARPPCPSTTPRVHPNSCPSSRWCHPAISSSVVPFSSCPQSLPASGSFPMSQLFTWGGQSFSLSISPSNEHPGLVSFRMNWLDILAVQGTLKSILKHHSSKASILWHSAIFTVQLSHSYMPTGKTIALTRWIFVDKVISLLFNMMSRLVITFLPRSKRLLISWLQSPSAVILEPKK